MEKLIRSKCFLIVFALPMFVFVMIGERYEAMGQPWHDPFSWRGQALEFWGELFDYLTGRRNAYFSKGIKANRRLCLKKIRRRARKRLVSKGAGDYVRTVYDRFVETYADTPLWFDVSLDNTGRTLLNIRTFTGVSWSRSRYYFERMDDEWVFVQYNEDQWKGTGDDEQRNIDDVYHCRRRKAYIPVSLDDMHDILDRFTCRNGQSWNPQTKPKGERTCS